MRGSTTCGGEVGRDITQGEEQIELEPIDRSNRTRSAKVKGTSGYLVMVSWRDLLKGMHDHAAGEPGIQENIRQLQGLAERMDSEEFLPLSDDELSQNVARRIRDLGRIYDEVNNRLNEKQWVNTEGYGKSAQGQTGFGRYLELSGYAAWFGVYYDLWARGDCEDTPFWIQLYGCERPTLNHVTRVLDLRLSNHHYAPIHLKVGVEIHAVVDHVVAQLKGIADAIASDN